MLRLWVDVGVEGDGECWTLESGVGPVGIGPKRSRRSSDLSGREPDADSHSRYNARLKDAVGWENLFVRADCRSGI